MDAACNGPKWVFFNTRPWPRLRGYVLSEGKRTVNYLVNGWPINSDSLSLELYQGDGSPPWSDDALVKFVFYDKSQWKTVTPETP